MKRILVTIAALVLSVGLASAQDLASVTEVYNSGAGAIAMGEKASALEFFMTAYTQAIALGEEGKEVADNCKNVIPQITLSIAKDFIKAKQYAEAITGLNKAVEVAGEFEDQAVIDEANDLLPKAMIQEAKAQIAAKKFDDAQALLSKVLEADPANGTAALYMGQALVSAGKSDEAVESFKVAAENGQKSVANKQIATILLKRASAELKAKDLENAIKTALESNEYNESATAYKIAGTAATTLAKKDEAITYLSKYLELSPKASDAAQITEAIEALKKQQ